MLTFWLTVASARMNATIEDISDWELARANKPKPTFAVAKEAHGLPKMLNKMILSNSPAEHKPCEDFSLDDLEPIYETVYLKSNPAFDGIYEPLNDNRRLQIKDPVQIAHRFANDRRRVEANPEEHDAIVASNCAEILMIYTHHLTQEEKATLKDAQLPLMSEIVDIDSMPDDLRRRRVTCSQCHQRGVSDYHDDVARLAKSIADYLNNP